MGHFSYPATEAVTDRLERAMDPYKLVRERLALELFLCFDWVNALDVGAGVGRHLEVFASVAGQTPTVQRSLKLVEPDDDRRRQLETRIRALASSAPYLRCSVHATLDELDAEASFDLVTSIQVLGHLTHVACEKLLTAMQAKLAPGAALVVFVPGVTDLGVIELGEPGARPGDDYHFVVQLDRMPFDEGYARALDRAGYEAIVHEQPPGQLPVRAFHVGSCDGSRLAAAPVPITDLPAPLRVRENFHAGLAFAYSIHRRSMANDQPTLVDVACRVILK